MLRKQAAFCGVEILNYCVMGNHFHLLVSVPEKVENFGCGQLPGTEGLLAKEGSMVDASFVAAARQRNRGEENQKIKQGERPGGFKANTARGRQKDCDVRWTKKNNGTNMAIRTSLRWTRRASC